MGLGRSAFGFSSRILYRKIERRLCGNGCYVRVCVAVNVEGK